MSDDLLEKIYALGENMRVALESEDVEAFYTLVEERGALLDQLNACANPLERSDAWNQIAERMREQHRILTDALARQEMRLQNSLGSLNRYKGAQRSYAGIEPRGTILRNHVKG